MYVTIIEHIELDREQRSVPEDSLDAAIQFGIDNAQDAIYIISTGTTIEIDE